MILYYSSKTICSYEEYQKSINTMMIISSNMMVSIANTLYTDDREQRRVEQSKALLASSLGQRMSLDAGDVRKGVRANPSNTHAILRAVGSNGFLYYVAHRVHTTCCREKLAGTHSQALTISCKQSCCRGKTSPVVHCYFYE